MKCILPILFLLSFTASSQSSACACCSENHRQFDFWEGDWAVFDTTGTNVGHNTIVFLQDSCALQENWASANMTGTSYNYFNGGDSSWNQVWIDNQGGSLLLKGKFENGSMVMRSKLLPGKKVPYYYNQITWTENKDGSVTQLWEICDENGGVLNVAFEGIYRKEIN